MSLDRRRTTLSPPTIASALQAAGTYFVPGFVATAEMLTTTPSSRHGLVWARSSASPTRRARARGIIDEAAETGKSPFDVVTAMVDKILEGARNGRG